MSLNPKTLFIVFALLAAPLAGRAQFLDNFDGPKTEGWFTGTGDGNATIDFTQKDGVARMHVDATHDKYGVWWTFIKRDISASLDMEKLKDPAYELRVEARVRSNHSPRRVNFMLNTSRTTNFHEHLREYDLPDGDWHVISMTTRHFDAKPGDNVFVQFCVTDFGPDKYDVDIDYYRADVVRRDQAGPDLGEPLHYRPPVPDLKTLTHHLGVTHDSVITSDFPDVNFNDWHVEEQGGTARALTVGSNQWIILRWDLGALQGLKADGAGILELTTCTLSIGGKYIERWGAGSRGGIWPDPCDRNFRR